MTKYSLHILEARTNTFVIFYSEKEVKQLTSYQYVR